MKAKKLFPDLSIKRLWDKIKGIEDKVNEQNKKIPYVDTNSYEEIFNVEAWGTTCTIDRTVDKNCILIGSIATYAGGSSRNSGVVFSVNDKYMFNISNNVEKNAIVTPVYLPLKKGDRLVVNRTDGNVRGILSLYDIG